MIIVIKIIWFKSYRKELLKSYLTVSDKENQTSASNSVAILNEVPFESEKSYIRAHCWLLVTSHFQISLINLKILDFRVEHNGNSTT